MFVYTVRTQDGILNAFIAELRLHILSAQTSYTNIQNQHLYYTKEKKREYTSSPNNLMISLTLFLNSTAMVCKLLGLTSKYETPHSKSILKLLDLCVTDLPNIKNLQLRNSLEHMEHRLNTLAEKCPDKIILWDMTKESKIQPNTLRKFNPVDLTVTFLDKELETVTLSLDKCFQELTLIDSRL